MQVRKATLDDMDLLIKLRIDFLLDENKVHGLRDVEIIEQKLRDYFMKWIPCGSFIAFIAEEDGAVLSAAFLSMVERPPRSADSSYLVGTVYNVFTYPQYRRKGIATKVVSALLEEAELSGVSSVDLLATNDGKPLYEKLGFTIANYTSMRIKLGSRTV